MLAAHVISGWVRPRRRGWCATLRRLVTRSAYRRADEMRAAISHVRRLLVVGMTSLVRRARARPDSVDPRFTAMLQRKPVRVVTVAAANRTARVAWAIMTRGGIYQAPLAAAA